ncbi:hypothetical protein [Streptomyces sp. NPDC048411]|uniref:hypothetical protein n=1 Tax=Streptomyces sp. NPDC048411 TaxID=3157206 RepID=UPI0034528622
MLPSGSGWIDGQDARLRRFFDAGEGAHGSPVRSRHLPSELDFVHRRVPWTRRVSLDTHLVNLGSHSAFLVLGEPTHRFLDEERDRLAELFPDGTVDVSFVVDLNVAIRPAQVYSAQPSRTTAHAWSLWCSSLRSSTTAGPCS